MARFAVDNTAPLHRLGLGLLLGCFAWAGCTETKQKQAVGGDGQALSRRPEGGFDHYQSSPLKNAAGQGTIAAILAPLEVGPAAEEDLWALALCQCAPRFAEKYFTTLARTPGVLPEPLVPSVREAIASDPKLRALAAIPPGPIAEIADLLAKVYTTDREISEQVRSGLNEKLSKALGAGGTDLKDRVNFVFDGFPSPLTGSATAQAGWAKDFTLSAQAARWAWIYNLDSMWETPGSDADEAAPTPNTDTKFLSAQDHGLQLFHTALALEEWQYLYGLKQSQSTGQPYGGLSIDPLTMASDSQLGIFDPRTDPNQPARLISGRYRINYPNTQSIELATNITELWMRIPETIDLDEQARMLYAAARAFKRLRPENRRATASLYAPNTGLFPDNSHLLPLVVLLGISKLLEGPLIALESFEREIYQTAQLSPPPGAVPPTPVLANLRSLARLSRALITWDGEIDNLDGAQLDPAQSGPLTDGRDSLRDAAGLGIQTILAHYVRHSNDLPAANVTGESTYYGFRFITNPNDVRAPRPAAAAEALVMLALADQGSFDSPHLHDRIVSLYHWFASEYLTQLAAGSAKDWQLADIFWAYSALKQFALYPEASTVAPWLQDALTTIESALNDWQRQLP